MRMTTMTVQSFILAKVVSITSLPLSSQFVMRSVSWPPASDMMVDDSMIGLSHWVMGSSRRGCCSRCGRQSQTSIQLLLVQNDIWIQGCPLPPWATPSMSPCYPTLVTSVVWVLSSSGLAGSFTSSSNLGVGVVTWLVHLSDGPLLSIVFLGISTTVGCGI